MTVLVLVEVIVTACLVVVYGTPVLMMVEVVWMMTSFLQETDAKYDLGLLFRGAKLAGDVLLLFAGPLYTHLGIDLFFPSVSGYSDEVVDSTGRNPSEVGIIVKSVVVTVVGSAVTVSVVKVCEVKVLVVYELIVEVNLSGGPEYVVVTVMDFFTVLVHVDGFGVNVDTW